MDVLQVQCEKLVVGKEKGLRVQRFNALRAFKVQNRKLACVALRSQDKLREVPTSRLESSWQKNQTNITSMPIQI